MTVELTLTWTTLGAAVTVLSGLVKIGLDVRTAWREDRRDLHRLADILRRDIYLTMKENEPNRKDRLRALLGEVNPIRDRLWEARGKPGARKK